MLGRYALYDEIASGGMATVHLGRLLGPVGLRAHGRDQATAPAVRQGSRVRRDVPRRGAARRAHPPPERRPHARRRRDARASCSSSWSTSHGESLSRLIASRARRGRSASRRRASSSRSWSGVLARPPRGARGEETSTGEPLGIVHRDVSPQNILVGVDGVARVLDFGVAKATGRLADDARRADQGQDRVHGAGAACEGTVTRATDVYAASVVLWEALTGKRLFQGENDAHVFDQVRKGCSEPPSKYVSNLPPMLDQVTMRGLSVDLGRALPHRARHGVCARGRRSARRSIEDRRVD